MKRWPFLMLSLAIALLFLSEGRKGQFPKPIPSKEEMATTPVAHTSVTKSLTRSIASIPTFKIIEPTEIIPWEEAKKQNITLTYEPDPEWEENLKDELLRFQEASTQVEIQKEKTLVQKSGEETRALEVILVIYTLKNGEKSSFHAKVDLTTGKIIRTWDTMVKENSPLRQMDLTLVPVEN